MATFIQPRWQILSIFLLTLFVGFSQSNVAFASAEPVVDSVAEEPAAEVSTTAKGALIACLTIFVLSIFIGFEVITKVPPTLHTPLMSGANAISGITLVGAVIAAGYAGANWKLVSAAGFVAVVLAAINAIGGFVVTGRMLAMFKKR